MANPENIGKDLLEQMAKTVGDKLQKTIALKSAKDAGLGWRGDAIHPQQNLETIHQKMAQEAARKVTVEDNPDAADQQQEAMEKELTRFYSMSLEEPTFLNEGGKEVADETYVATLAEAKTVLDAVDASLNLRDTAKDNTGNLSISVEPCVRISDTMDQATVKVYVIDTSIIAEDKKKEVTITVTPELGDDDTNKVCLTAPSVTVAPTAGRQNTYKTETAKGRVSANLYTGNMEGKVEIKASAGAMSASVHLLIVRQDEHAKFIKDTQKRLGDLKEKLKGVYEKFKFGDVNAKDYTPILKAVEDGLVRLDVNQNNFEDLKSLCEIEFKEILSNLQSIAEGLAQIQMLFGISAFYLFRLLVPFSIVADKELGKGDKRGASGDLTDILNNGKDMKWVREWLKTKMVSIANALSKGVEDAGSKVFFYLKGGRALYYLLKDEDNAQNDWDTAIVINPDLPAAEWYETFNKVHNIVLRELRQAKQEFFVLIHKNKADAEKRINEFATGVKPLPDDLRADQYIEEVGNSCKAELIDIGIPRRDTIEAIEQWHHYHDPKNRFCEDWSANIWIPNHLYFVDEYIVMGREALAGISPAPHKAFKRIDRLHRILKLDDNTLDGVIGKIKSHIGTLYTQSGDLPKVTDPTWAGRIAAVLLDQFMDSYNLKMEPGLAKIVDAKFKETYDKRNSLTIASNVLDALKKKDDEQKTLEKILRWVAIADTVSGWRPDASTMFEKHFQDRADFFGFSHSKETFLGEKWDSKIPVTTTPSSPDERRRLISALIKSIHTYNALLFNGEVVEYQIAVGGSLAAYLHADAARLEKSVREAMDPVSTVDLHVYLFQPAHDPVAAADNVFELALEKVITEYKANFELQKPGDGTFNLYWPKEEKFGDFDAYKPLIIRISVKSGKWPRLSFIKGFPVLSLRDLALDYDRKSALTPEWGRTQKLKVTSGILKELMTRFDYSTEGHTLDTRLVLYRPPDF